VLSRWRSLAREATFPAVVPRIQFDHALVRDDPDRRLPAVAAVETVLTEVSDHRALAVDLRTGG
jgi:endonuclease/exonuclease/phosphatase family metal-dependent hydrolase